MNDGALYIYIKCFKTNQILSKPIVLATTTNL